MWTINWIKTEDGRRKTKCHRAFSFVCLLSSFVLAASCRQDMHDAPRYDPLEKSAVFPNASSAQPLVEGTVPRAAAAGAMLDENELLHTGKVNGEFSDAVPFAMTRADLDRGEERYNIYCSPCHSRIGDGNGMVVQRGYRQASSYHIDRLRRMPLGYFVDVMTNGFGAMPDYRAQITPEDRWRVAAYVRALQLSHEATEKDVPADELQRLKSGAPATTPKAPEGNK